jgi:hypothetical protein
VRNPEKRKSANHQTRESPAQAALRYAKKTVAVLWASPNTLIGLLVGLVGLCTGGQVQFRRGCFEFYGGFAKWFVRHLPLGDLTLAVTLGHTILGQNTSGLGIARDHEHVHVAQYERWGPFFLPAYFVSSAWLWFKGHDAYRDNPFEVEAYSSDPLRVPSRKKRKK